MHPNVSLLILISVIVLPFLVSLFLTFKSMVILKTDIIEIRENILKISLAIYVHIIYFLFSFFQVFHITASLNNNGDESYMVAFIISISFFPTLSIVFNYFNINRYLIKKYRLSEAGKQPINGKEQLESYVKRISEILNLKSPPKVLFSDQKNFPPFVFGKSSRKSFIAFPINWNEILKKIGKGDDKVEKGIRDFVVIHELSHIKHRDHVFISVSYSFLKSFKYWLIGIISLLIFSLLKIDAMARNSLYIIMLFGLVYYLILFFLTMSVSRKREYFADARSSLVMPGSELEPLFSRKVEVQKRKESYFKYMLDWFSIFPKMKANILGISGSQLSSNDLTKKKLKSIGNTKLWDRISKLGDYIFSTHPKSGVRQKNLQENNKDKLKYNAISAGTAVWIGIIFAFFKTTFRFLPDELIDGMMLSGHSIRVQMETFVLIFIILITSMLFLFSLTGSPAIISSFRSRISYLAKGYLIIYLTFCLSISMLLFFRGLIKGNFVFANKDFMVWLLVWFQIYFEAFFLGFLLTTLFLSIYSSNIYTSTNIIAKDQKRMGSVAFFGFGIFLVFVLFLLQLKLNILSIAFGAAIGVIVIVFIHMICPILDSFKQAWIVWGIKDFFVKFETKFTTLISVLVPIVILCAVTFILAISINDMAVQKKEVFEYSLYAVGIFVAISISVTAKALRPSYQDVGTYFDSIDKYLYILQGLGRIEYISDKEEFIRKKIDSYILKDNSFANSRRINFGTSSSSYLGLCLLSYIGSEKTYSKSAEWFLGLENDKGGFAPIPGFKSRLLSTYQTLSILEKFNMLERTRNLEVHSKWVTSLQAEGGSFLSPLSEYSRLEQTFCALSSLKILGNLNVINKDACSDWIYRAWEEDRNNPLTIFYSIKSLELLGMLTEDLKQKVRDDWLIHISSYWKKLKIDKNLLYFYYCFRVAELVLDSPADIEDLIPDLGEKVSKGLEYYLKNR